MKRNRISRTRGGCSCCDRGKGKTSKGVVLIRLESARKVYVTRSVDGARREWKGAGWLGICLKCAALIAKELGR